MIILFSIILLSLIFGLVYMEKSIETNPLYSKEDIFPVIIGHITNYIQTTGSNLFLLQVFIGASALLGLSIFISLYLVYRKDIGDIS